MPEPAACPTPDQNEVHASIPAPDGSRVPNPADPTAILGRAPRARLIRRVCLAFDLYQVCQKALCANLPQAAPGTLCGCIWSAKRK